MSRHTTSYMRWHKEKQILRHLIDSKVWKDTDIQFSWFSQDPQNVQLRLAIDGLIHLGA